VSALLFPWFHSSSTTVSTLRRVQEVLFNINERSQLFDYATVNETATRARETAALVLPGVSQLAD